MQNDTLDERETPVMGTEMTEQEYADLMYYEEVASRVTRARENFPDEYRAWKRNELARAQRIVAEYGPEFADEETNTCAF